MSEPRTKESLARPVLTDDPAFVQRAGWGLVIIGVSVGLGVALLLGWILSR